MSVRTPFHSLHFFRRSQSLGHAACILGYRVRYATSAKLLREFTAALADGTFEHTLDSYARYDLLLIDEFGFDRLEREIPSQASAFRVFVWP